MRDREGSFVRVFDASRDHVLSSPSIWTQPHISPTQTKQCVSGVRELLHPYHYHKTYHYHYRISSMF